MVRVWSGYDKGTSTDGYNGDGMARVRSARVCAGEMACVVVLGAIDGGVEVDGRMNLGLSYDL